MDPAKVTAIRDWPELQNINNVRYFLGFANFYRRFIKGFSKITEPLIKPTKKGVKFTLSLTINTAFDQLLSIFISNLILAHYDSDRKTIVETDISDFVSGRVLS